MVLVFISTYAFLTGMMLVLYKLEIRVGIPGVSFPSVVALLPVATMGKAHIPAKHITNDYELDFIDMSV